MLRPRALQAGDRIAIVAPASPFAREELDAGVRELRELGFEPVFSESVFAREGYVAGAPEVRARDFLDWWTDPSVAAMIAVRGGYGSVQLLQLLDADAVRAHPKAFIGYSDNTSLMIWLAQACGLITFHGPMIEKRLAAGPSRYDRDSFVRCLTRPEPLGELAPAGLEALAPGEAGGELLGGTLSQIVASLGTPFAFDPPAGCVLLLDEVGERPYRLDRMLTQLRLSGLLVRVSAIVFNELPRCGEPGGAPTAKDAIRQALKDFPGPMLFGFPSGHGDGATITLPLGARVRVRADRHPALVVEEAAVS